MVGGSTLRSTSNPRIKIPNSDILCRIRCMFLTTWLLLDSRSSTSVLSSLLQWVISPLNSLRMNSYSCLLTVPSATMWRIMGQDGAWAESIELINNSVYIQIQIAMLFLEKIQFLIYWKCSAFSVSIPSISRYYCPWAHYGYKILWLQIFHWDSVFFLLCALFLFYEDLFWLYMHYIKMTRNIIDCSI